MKLKYLAMGALSIYGMFVMVACGNKASTNDNNNIAPYAVCPANTIYQNNGTCTGVANVDSGYLAETQRNSNLSITNSGVFTKFLEKAHGVCNRAKISAGQASCDSWVTGYFATTIQTVANQGNTMKMTFFTQPNVNPYGYYSVQLPSAGQLLAGLLGFPVFSSSGAYRQLFQIDAVVSVINAYKGFEARAYGPIDTGANRSLIQLQVENGKLLDDHLDFKLSFEGQQMAAGFLWLLWM